MYCIIFQNELSIEQALNHNDRIILHWDIRIFPKYWPTVLWLAYDSLYDFVWQCLWLCLWLWLWLCLLFKCCKADSADHSLVALNWKDIDKNQLKGQRSLTAVCMLQHRFCWSFSLGLEWKRNFWAKKTSMKTSWDCKVVIEVLWRSLAAVYMLQSWFCWSFYGEF